MSRDLWACGKEGQEAQKVWSSRRGKVGQGLVEEGKAVSVHAGALSSHTLASQRRKAGRSDGQAAHGRRLGKHEASTVACNLAAIACLLLGDPAITLSASVHLGATDGPRVVPDSCARPLRMSAHAHALSAPAAAPC